MRWRKRWTRAIAACRLAELVPLATTLLEVLAELVQTALELELAEGTVVADSVGETACILLVGLYGAEQVIAERIRCLAAGALP